MMTAVCQCTMPGNCLVQLVVEVRYTDSFVCKMHDVEVFFLFACSDASQIVQERLASIFILMLTQYNVWQQGRDRLSSQYRLQASIGRTVAHGDSFGVDDGIVLCWNVHGYGQWRGSRCILRVSRSP